MKKINWKKKKTDYSGQTLYLTNKCILETAAFYKKTMMGMAEVRVNRGRGVNASVYVLVIWPTYEDWGFEIFHHFQGKNQTSRAKTWCEHLLKEPVDYKYDIDDAGCRSLRKHFGFRQKPLLK
jgi:hypothetical protein